MKLVALLAALSLSGCLKVDVKPVTIDVPAMKAYVRPTNPKYKDQDWDLTNPTEFKKLNKMTCFSADDLAVIERALNQ